MPNVTQDAGISQGNALVRDLTAGGVVFLVALPLCLGVALASNAPLFAGLLAGILGGIVVGLVSQSQTSVSGPAAGLTAIVAAQIAMLGSFESFLLAVMIAGIFQIVLGLLRAGFIAAFFPSSVIKGLLAGIGVILILKQFPHVVGHDADPEGEMAFLQPNDRNTFTEIAETLSDLHWGAAVIGLGSVALLMLWDRWKVLKKSPIPAPLVVVLLGVGFKLWFDELGGRWLIETSHLVQVPIAESFADFIGFARLPDFTQFNNPAVYTAGLTIGMVASLETLLNLEAVDKLDPKQRSSPANRELFAQGVGNVLAGLIGALPVTSVIVRSSVNIHAGAQTKLATIVHGGLLLICVGLLPVCLNMIPLSCLAAILLVTGLKLASPALFRQMWSGGPYQVIPFIVTLVAIVMTDLLVGILIGLAVSISFILHSNLRRPLRRIVEKHLGGDVLKIELASQVSFLNRAALEKVLRDIPPGSQVLIDARSTVYFDPDVLDLIRDFKEQIAPAHGVKVSLLGFRSHYQLDDQIQYVDYSSRDVRNQLTPKQVLQIMTDGNERFRTGRRLTRDLGRQVSATADGQHPLAVVLSCIDSRTPAEIIFDLGLGDIFSIRVAGNVLSRKVLGSMEYGCAVAGAKLIMVVGHTRCGAVTTAVNFAASHESAAQVTGCQHLDHVVQEIQESIDADTIVGFPAMSPADRSKKVDEVAHWHVLRVIESILEQSEVLNRLVREGQIAMVGAIYDVTTGGIQVLSHDHPHWRNQPKGLWSSINRI